MSKGEQRRAKVSTRLDVGHRCMGGSYLGRVGAGRVDADPEAVLNRNRSAVVVPDRQAVLDHGGLLRLGGHGGRGQQERLRGRCVGCLAGLARSPVPAGVVLGPLGVGGLLRCQGQGGGWEGRAHRQVRRREAPPGKVANTRAAADGRGSGAEGGRHANTHARTLS